MPESAGTAKADIPEDIKHLKNFPHYDASLHDNPKFRQNLSSWANKTEKLSTVLDALANGFSDFYSTGLQQYKAASSIVGSLQKMSQLLENSSPTITDTLNKFVESMNNMWYYYETFLEQTQTLTVDPIRKMAKQFSILKGIYEELQHYRKEFIMAADQMCACRHVSKLNDSQQFNQLAETCYNAQKTYQLVLSKYLTCLREAHTSDQMDLLRKLMEHFLTIYSYHNYCAEQMKDMEVYLTHLHSQTKEWKLFYCSEMELWNELQRQIKRVVMFEHQHHVDLLPTSGTRLGMLKVASKKKGLHSSTTGLGPSPMIPFARTFSDQIPQSSLPSPSLTLDHPPKHISSPVQVHKPINETSQTSPKSSALRTFSIPIFPETETSDKKLPFFERLKTRSNSDANLISPGLEEESEDDVLGSLRRRSQSIDDILSGDEKEASLETASRKIEAALGERKGKSSHKPLLSLWTNMRKEGKERKKQRKRTPSQGGDDQAEEARSRSGSTTPVDCQSMDNSPYTNRKKKQSLQKKLKKARNSLYLFQQSERQDDKRGEEEELEGRGSVEGGLSVEGSSISSGDQPLDSNSITNVCPPSPATGYANAVPVSPPHPREGEVKELIQPTPPSWIRSGYLMLRMKLPNNTYAWTYIYCVVHRELGQLMVQEQSLPEPRPLEDLMLCTCKAGTPDFIDRNYCFRVISPSSEHLFQALGEDDMKLWMSAVQEGIEEVIKHGDTGTRPAIGKREDEGELVPNAIKTILKVPGNKQCADCSSTDVQWASINLGIVLCIECSGVHRGLGVHVSKVRSLTLDKWNKSTVEFMKSQGNTKSNVYYEARLGKGIQYSDIHKPSANAGKTERIQFIQLKYVTLAFTPELTDH